MGIIYGVLRFHAEFLSFSFISLALLDDTSIKKKEGEGGGLFTRGSRIDHLCSTFWAKVEKAKGIKEILLVGRKQLNTWKDWMKKCRRNLDAIQKIFD